MHSSTALTTSGPRAAAMSRHPSAGLRSTAARGYPRPGRRDSFAALVDLLTGPWRTEDADGFAAAMTGAPLIGGHPVLEAALLGEAAADPWSARAMDGLRAALAGAASRIEPRSVAGQHVDQAGGRQLFVEARGRAPAGVAGPEIFVVAHLVEQLGPRGERSRGRAGHSWVVAVVGDGSGGVSAVLRAVLACPDGGCPSPPAWARLALAALRERLVASALDDVGAGPRETTGATVIPLRRP